MQLNNLRQVPREIALSFRACCPGYYQEGSLRFSRETKSDTSMCWTKEQQISRANKQYITRPSYASADAPTSVRPRNLASMIPMYIWLDCHSGGKSCDRGQQMVLQGWPTGLRHHKGSVHHTQARSTTQVEARATRRKQTRQGATRYDEETYRIQPLQSLQRRR